jgi:hypothetical protein
MDMLTAILNAAKGIRTGGVSVSLLGLYSAQYTKNFPDPDQVYAAGWVCVGMMLSGAVVQLYNSVS